MCVNAHGIMLMLSSVHSATHLIYIHIWKSLGMLFIYSWGVFPLITRAICSFRWRFSHSNHVLYVYVSVRLKAFAEMYLSRSCLISLTLALYLSFSAHHTDYCHSQLRIHWIHTHAHHTLNLKSNWPSIYLTSYVESRYCVCVCLVILVIEASCCATQPNISCNTTNINFGFLSI